MNAAFEAGDKVIYMRSDPVGFGIEELPATYVSPHGAKKPYGWRRHLILCKGKRLYVNLTSIRSADDVR